MTDEEHRTAARRAAARKLIADLPPLTDSAIAELSRIGARLDAQAAAEHAAEHAARLDAVEDADETVPFPGPWDIDIDVYADAEEEPLTLEDESFVAQHSMAGEHRSDGRCTLRCSCQWEHVETLVRGASPDSDENVIRVLSRLASAGRDHLADALRTAGRS